MNACPPHQNLDWSSCVAHSRSMWWKITAHDTYNEPKNAKKKKEKKVFTWAIWGSWSFSLITVMPEVRIGSQTGTRTWESLLTSSDTCEGHADNVTYKYLAQHNSSNNIHDTIYRIWLVESNPVLMQKQGNKRQIFQRIAHCDWLMKNSNT